MLPMNWLADNFFQEEACDNDTTATVIVIVAREFVQNPLLPYLGSGIIINSIDFPSRSVQNVAAMYRTVLSYAGNVLYFSMAPTMKNADQASNRRDNRRRRLRRRLP